MHTQGLRHCHRHLNFLCIYACVPPQASSMYVYICVCIAAPNIMSHTGRGRGCYGTTTGIRRLYWNKQSGSRRGRGMNVCVFVCMYVCRYVCVFAYMYDSDIHTYTCAHKRKHRRIYTHILETQTQIRAHMRVNM